MRKNLLKQNKYILKNLLFVAKTKNSGVGVIASYAVVLTYLYILTDIFILIAYRMGSFYRHNETLFHFFVIVKII